MHEGLLAIAPYALLSVASVTTGVLFVAAVVARIRARLMLVGAAAFLLLGIWFACIAVTAGPAPVVRRGELAEFMRWLAVLVAAVWLLWLSLYSWSLITIRKI